MQKDITKLENITFVVIGRNEEKNLKRCIKSIIKYTDNIIYVDSGSADDSVKLVKKWKFIKLIQYEADHSTPGMSRMIGVKWVNTKYVQFLDGDMALEAGWIERAMERFDEDSKIAIVHGFKKVFTKNENDFTILSDKRDWQADYLQGAFLAKKEIFNKVGGIDPRFPGEEERDLYVRIKANGNTVWYLHNLMASHYDFKNKSTNLKHLFWSDTCATYWMVLFESIKSGMLSSYCFVYRTLLVSLLLDFLSIIVLFKGVIGLLFVLLIQTIHVVYVLSIKRPGFFVIWKGAFINIHRVKNLINKDTTYSIK